MKNKKYLFIKYSYFLFKTRSITKKSDDKVNAKSERKGPVISNSGKSNIGNLKIKTFSI